MRKKLSSILAVIMAFALVMTVVPAEVQAADPFSTPAPMPVSPPPPGAPGGENPDNIRISKETLTLGVNVTGRLEIQGVSYASWTSSDPSVVKITGYASYTQTNWCDLIGVAPGEAMITATADNGSTATCKITVLDAKDYYNPGDVAVINKLIENNGLKGFKKDDPANWQFENGGFVTWSEGRITELYLSNKRLNGNASFAGLDELLWLYVGDMSPVIEGESDESKNNLSSLDISENKKLKYLECSNNKLILLDVSKCVSLEYLECGGNKLTALNVTKNPKLKHILCSYNVITKLNLSQNPKLGSLYCNNNKLTALDISKNKELVFLRCEGNPMPDISGTIDGDVYDITADGSGSVGLEAGDKTAASRSFTSKVSKNFTVYATPKKGWKFLNWTDKNGKVVSTKEKATFAVSKTNKLTAKFVKANYVAVKTIKIPKTLTLKRGKTHTFKPMFAPSNATDKRVTWVSDKKKIVTVSSKGVIKALKKGKAIITVRTANGKWAKCVVTVK